MNETLTYTLTYKEVVAMLRAVREADSIDAFQLEFGDLKLSVTRTPATTARPAVAPTTTLTLPAADIAGPSSALGRKTEPRPTSTLTPTATSATHGAEVAVKAPMLGTFYRAPSPSEPLFVTEGDVINEDHTIGLIEAMKLFTAIPAGVAGKVVRVVAPDATLVEFGQVLVIVDPSQV